MSIEHREMLWAVQASQHRSLRKAAEWLNIRQSTLSRSLRNLEQRLGIELFERTSGGTQPTPAGREFLLDAKRILDAIDALALAAKSRAIGETGTLKLGLCAALSTGNLRATLVEHRQRFPEVSVTLVDGTTNYLMSEVADGTLDIAFVLENGLRWQGRSLRIWAERILLVVPQTHRFAEAASIYWSELRGETLLASERGPCTQLCELAVSKVGGAGFVQIKRHDAALDRLIALVGVDFGLLLVLESAAGLSCGEVAFREVHDTNGPALINFQAIWRSENQNAALPPLLSLIQERYPDFARQN